LKIPTTSGDVHTGSFKKFTARIPCFDSANRTLSLSHLGDSLRENFKAKTPSHERGHNQEYY